MPSIEERAKSLIARATAMRSGAKAELQSATGETSEYLNRCINLLDKAIFAAKLAKSSGDEKYQRIAERAESEAFGWIDPE